jgi:hypothetical protein
MRAAGSDLTISVSPLGLIELADEEFEVHGPRLTRYANAAAFYLGHHWAYRRPPGEPQVTANYVAALSDFLTNFTFGKGIQFAVDPEFQHITPALLDRIWSQDNNKEELLWAIGNSGSIYGDTFTKIAYEPAWTDGAGMEHPGRVRILPINPSFAFPEWHPHDKDRMIRFKLKYRFWTTSPEGTRIVCTYVEIITDDYIEEYINDQLIDRRPNPLGFIPVVHIANKPVLASPWGLSDIIDIIPLNRTYNETATDILDIINYHTAPVTIITGAKATNLEMGANKIWALQQKDARVENLSGGFEGLAPALEFLDRIKAWMHEITGVPENSLGQEQAISNTSGVALAIQYFPTMLKYHLKKVQYGTGLRKICEMALRTLFVFEPDRVFYDKETDGIWREGLPLWLDPADPQVYNIDITWPEPLPTDTLVKLNEIQAKLALELESRKGALRELGEQFPDEKLEELFQEQLDDAKHVAAKRILMAHIDSIIMALTGIIPEGAGEPVPGNETQTTETRKPDGTKTTQTRETTSGVPQQQGLPKLPSLSPELNSLIGGAGGSILSDIVTQAYGTKLPQRRIIDKNDNDGLSQ